jgi:acetolactate synthase I/II/III large subunit
VPDQVSPGDLIARALKDADAGPIFTLNGGHIWGVYLGAAGLGLPMFDVRHEQTAGFAAEGWAKLTRRCGVAAVTAGPGVTNAMSAIAAAYQNDSPVLFIGGRAPISRWGMGSLQELDHVPLVAGITKSAGTVEAPEKAQVMTAEAIRTALSCRTGPTFVDVPMDVFFQSAEASDAPPEQTIDRGAPPDMDVVRRIVTLLREAECPAIVAGGGVWWACAEDELLRFADAAGVPVVLNGMARGMLPPDHRLFASRARGIALGEADLVVVIGVPLDFRLNFGRAPVMPDAGKVVYIDVDDHRKHRPPAAALYGDIRLALSALAEAADGLGSRNGWLDHVTTANRSAQADDAHLAATDGSPVHPARLLAEVERFCDPDAILVGDGGDFVSFAGRLIHRRRPGLWVDGGPYGCLGSGPGYAMAAKIVHPGRQVVLLSGDGAFGFAAMEFETMVRHRIPVVCVIGNNGIWALEKHPMKRYLGTSILADLAPGIRYDKVVEALGGHGELVERPEDIAPALDRAFKAGVPACVNVLCDPTAEYPRASALI